MSASLQSKDPSGAEASSPATGKGGFYLRVRTKVWILAVCLTLMIAASVLAVLQPLKSDPNDQSPFTWLRYPHETNPYARLQGVRCADDYACRLNSVAVNGAGNLPEVWAVGNVGLVLHRAAGQTKWEQLTITAKPAGAASPSPTPAPSPLPTPTPGPGPSKTPRPVPSLTPTPRTSQAPAPTPTPVPASTPSQAPTPTSTPTPTPEQTVSVPNLIGLRIEEARRIAASYGVPLVEMPLENVNAPNSPAQQNNPSLQSQQAPSADLRIIRQSPAPGTQIKRGSQITVTLGVPPKAKGSLLDKLIPTVYAAEPDKQPRRTAPANVPARTPVSHPIRTRLVNSEPAYQPSPPVALADDDLLFVGCDAFPCHVLGRSGRIYEISSGNEWTFTQTTFGDASGTPLKDFSLVNAMDGENLIGKSGSTAFRCTASQNPRVQYECVPDTALIPTADNRLKTTLSNGQTGEFFRFRLDNFQGVRLLLSTGGSIEKLAANRGVDSARPIPSNTSATLRAYAFVAQTYGFIVGDQGTILGSADRGETWRHETQGPEGAAPNHRLPAGWYWASAFLLILACSVVAAIPGPPPVTEATVADWTVTDAPLKPGDLDSLDFTPMALGLSRFIRNPKTQPPVTIAIEGEWGEGKSSVMSLLQGDLKKSRFRPVWFNAWHHQSEDQLLAALLEHIKGQAIPPWWHVDNWIFRARLLRERFGDKWLLAVLLVVAVGGGITFELTRHGLQWEDFVGFGKDSVVLFKYLLPWSNQSKPPDDLSHFGVIATILAAFATIFKKGRTFGIDPAKLVDNLRDAATIKDIKPEPGIRRQFAREFADLCQAWSWGSRRVIIFIDDLDRCRPESVVTILESINFLTTAGDCMIVLGMAQNQVTHCVGLGFKDIAQTEAAYQGGGNTEQEKAVARFKFGEFYIRKLVNIVAPLPKTTPEKRRLMLEARAVEARRRDEEQKAAEGAGWRVHLWAKLSQAAQVAFIAAPVVALLAVVFFSVLVGYNAGTQARQRDEHAALAGKAVIPPPLSTPTPVAGPTPSPQVRARNEVAQPLVYSRPTNQPASLAAPDNQATGVWSSYAVDGIFLFILFGILGYELTARTNQDAQNSKDFEKSLALWGNYISGICDTPREIKRALNDLRYQAMMRRKSASSATRGERMARTLRQWITGRTEPALAIASVDEAALPPLKAAALANLTDEENRSFLDPANLDPKGSEAFRQLTEIKIKHIKDFGRWIGGPVPAAPEQNQAVNLSGTARQA